MPLRQSLGVIWRIDLALTDGDAGDIQNFPHKYETSHHPPVLQSQCRLIILSISYLTFQPRLYFLTAF